MIAIYPKDLNEDLINECHHFGSYLKEKEITCISALKSCQLICKNNFTDVYPNLYTALSFLLCMMTSNCSGERSFSVLKRIKNYLRSTQGDNRFNYLALLCIEAELMYEIDYDPLIDAFSKLKTRKVIL